MDLVDEQDVALVERGEDRGEVAGPLDGRARGVADVDAELAGDDRREGRLAEAGRAVQQDVVGRLSPALRRLEQHRQVRLDLALADVLAERLGAAASPRRSGRCPRRDRRTGCAKRRRPSRADGSTGAGHIARMFYVHGGGRPRAGPFRQCCLRPLRRTALARAQRQKLRPETGMADACCGMARVAPGEPLCPKTSPRGAYRATVQA